MSDYRIDLTVRNNRIVRRMRAAGILSVAELVRRMETGSQADVGQVIALRKAPFTQSGEWRKCVLNMAEVLGCMPDDLFSPAQREMRLESNKAHIEATEAEVEMLAGSRQQAAIPADKQIERQELMEALYKAIANLIPRDQRVLKMRYGLENGQPMTLQEIGTVEGVQKERIRQRLARAHKNLGRACYARDLLQQLGLPTDRNHSMFYDRGKAVLP